ncbi:hypothetical protein [Streptococcus marmotae]
MKKAVRDNRPILISFPFLCHVDFFVLQRLVGTVQEAVSKEV